MTAKKKTKLDRTLKLNAYTIISDAVEKAAQTGVRRAYKHTDTPCQDDISTAVHDAVMSELSDIIDFSGCF